VDWRGRQGITSGRFFWCACLAIAAALLAIELSFLTLPGIQQDEALFVRPFLAGESALFNLHVGNFRAPVMLMDYIGCLKTWLYWPVFRTWPPGVWPVRLPVCLASIWTLLLFAGLTRRIGGVRVAIGAAILLAGDASFVFTDVFDWGPVALLLTGALGFLALLERFGESGSRPLLAAAFALAGAMLWYKAVFAFPMAGILIACAAVFPRRLWQRASAGTLAIALAALLVGASPLLLFNIRTGGATLKAWSQLAPIPASEKLMMLRLTLNGKALEHYMVRSLPGEVLPLRGAPIGELVKTWYRNSTLGPGSFLFFALLMSAVALPLLRASLLFKPIVFAWVAGLSTVALFFVAGSSGAGPHHTVLMYPAPHFIVAATTAALAERMRGFWRYGLVFGVVALVGASDAVLLVNYHRAALRNGFSVYWTDATRQLPGVIRNAGKPVTFLDWGIEAPARIESGDAIRVVEPAPAREGVLYITHTADYLVAESGTEGIVTDASSRGLAVSDARAIADSHGNAVLSVFSFAPARRR
jgi:hypothetical protein